MNDILGWSLWICPSEGEINRQAYTFCVLEKLVEGLRRRDLFVSPRVQWSNPQAKLLHGKEWDTVCPQICRTLNLAPTPEKELVRLGQQLNDAYQRTAQNLPTNAAVRSEQDNGRESLTISHLDKLEEPDSLQILRHQVAALLPRVDLPEVILEIHAKTGFLDEFTHAHEEGHRAANLPISLCAVLIATACNIGLSPLQRKDSATLNHHRLGWVQQHYVRAETLIQANARLVDAQSQIPIIHAWGVARLPLPMAYDLWFPLKP